MRKKEKSLNFKEYFKTTIFYEFIVSLPRFIKEHHSVLAVLVIAIFAVGIATYPIIDKMYKGSKTSHQNYDAQNLMKLNEDTIININTATIEELCQLPGIGEKTAEDIIEYRELTGGFDTIEDIQNINGIDPDTFKKIKNNITV